MSLISRKTFFGNPDKLCVRLSPDGQYLAYIAPLEGVLNVFVAPSDNLEDARPLTHEKKRGIRSFSWLYTAKHIVYSKDADGDENWQVRLVDVLSKEDKGLSPEKGVNAHIDSISQSHPEKLILSHNERNKELFDPYLVDLTTGAFEKIYENPGYVGFVFDEDLQLVYASRMNEDGSISYDKPLSSKLEHFEEVERIPYDDVIGTNPILFSKDGKTLYWKDSRAGDTVAVVAVDLVTGGKKTLASDPQADIDSVLFNPVTKAFEGYAATYGRRKWTILDAERQKDFEFLKGALEGEIEITSQTLDNERWIVITHGDRVPVSYYLFDRVQQKLSYLFASHEALQGLSLNAMHDVYIKTRDNLELVSYITLPRSCDPDQTGKASKPVPLVLNVHGGPQARDEWGYDALHQWLSNRGYAVLSVNYRSSTGFGKKFRNMGDGEWSRKMHTDLLDAVAWAVDQGITTKDQVCICGGSYGGYAALVGLTFTPDTFACAVDIVGPSNLETLLASVPPYWKPIVKMLEHRLGGDLESDEGRHELQVRSPITKADAIKKPLLIGQGANDPRVKQAESDQIVHVLKEKGIPVTYVLFPDEGHGFARPENRMAFFAIMEAFLGQHLGGQVEPIGEDFAGSSYQLLESGPEIETLLKTAS